MEDYLYRLLRFYHNLPDTIKLLIGKIYNLIPIRIKQGNFYFKYKKRIQYFWNLTDNKENKNAQIKLLLANVNYAIRYIEFYNKYGICNSLDDFIKLPIINKSIILANKEKLINKNKKHKALITNTGGSSGNPLDFYLEKNVSRAKEKAHFDWYWGQFGFKKNDKILMIRGLPLKNNKLFEYQPINNILNISCYLVNKQNISKICNEINRFKPKYIHAYPSSLRIFTEYIIESGAKLDIQIIISFLGSEHLLEKDRILFKEFYKCKVVDWYGHTERLIHGGNCPYSKEYHFYPFYGYIEIVDDNDNIIVKPGKKGRIIATGFDNKVMPFIRYDTGDIGVLSEMQECKCGFNGYTLKMIIGRRQDCIYLSDKTKVSLTAFIFGQHFKQFNKIKELQIIQNNIGEITILVSLKDIIMSFDKEPFIKKLKDSVNNKINIDLKIVDRIEKTNRGKHVFLKQNVRE